MLIATLKAWKDLKICTLFDNHFSFLKLVFVILSIFLEMY